VTISWQQRRDLLEAVNPLLDFEGVVNTASLGYDERIVHRSSPSGGRHLDLVLKTLDISESDGIIDVGCGKGSAMKTLMRYPFKRCDGLEISESLGVIARRNFEILGVQTEIFTGDAALFKGFDRYTFFYLYNPFPPAILVNFIENMHSYNKNQTTIIYNTPSGGLHLEGLGYKLVSHHPRDDGSGNYTNVYKRYN